MLDYLKALPQYLLPHHLLSRLMLRFTRIRTPWIKNGYTRWMAKQFRINLDEAQEPDPTAYEHFNDFFTRALKPGARPIDNTQGGIASPVDGTISQLGTIKDGRIFQAKGRSFDLLELLGGSKARAAQFVDGSFATIYLSPSNYHRIHIPLAGKLQEMCHVPGRLFSVSPATTRVVPNLFARNERVVAVFETAFGPMAMIMVGAIFVGSIETQWSGVVTPPRGLDISLTDYSKEPLAFSKGDEIARFNMGSTVVLLFPRETMEWQADQKPGMPVKMGQLLGAMT